MVDDSQKRVAAPYIAFSTLGTFVSPLKEHVVPNRIDRSLLKSMSGAVQGQLMTALRFLGLIDGDDRPTSNLKTLVSAYGTDQYKTELKVVLEGAYPEIFRLPLASISPQEFTEAFKDAYPCEGETLRKGITFFLNASREAGVPLSPFLTKNAKPRAGGQTRRKLWTGKKVKAAAEGAGAGAGAVAENDGNDGSKGGKGNNQVQKTLGEQLLAKFPEFDPKWPDDIKGKWFEGYEKLLGMK